MDTSLTDAQAREHMYHLLAETLEGLPPGASWSLKSDSGRGEFDRGITMVCSDSDAATAADTRVNVQMRYWLRGVPQGKDQEYFQQLVKTWERWGWVRRTGSDSNWSSYHEPGDSEGYMMAVTDAKNGAGSVSIGVSSPCFWSKDDAKVDPPLQKA